MRIGRLDLPSIRLGTALIAALGLVATVLGLTGPLGAADAAPGDGRLYLIQGVTKTSWTFELDGEVVSRDAAAKDVIGPLDLAPGTHRLTAVSGDQRIEASLDVPAGASMDAVLHRPVSADGEPLFTTFENDLKPVPADQGRLTVAHTAAVGPADIRVDGEVLFSDVASGDELTVTVPGDTYPVDIVPAAAKGPAVLGPVDLPVEPGALTRVFAIGVAADRSMDAVVQVIDLDQSDSGTAGADGTGPPSSIAAGTGGQAATSFTDSSTEAAADEPKRDGSALGALALTGGLLLLGWVAVRLRRRERRDG